MSERVLKRAIIQEHLTEGLQTRKHTLQIVIVMALICKTPQASEPDTIDYRQVFGISGSKFCLEELDFLVVKRWENRVFIHFWNQLQGLLAQEQQIQLEVDYLQDSMLQLEDYNQDLENKIVQKDIVITFLKSRSATARNTLETHSTKLPDLLVFTDSVEPAIEDQASKI